MGKKYIVTAEGNAVFQNENVKTKHTVICNGLPDAITVTAAVDVLKQWVNACTYWNAGTAFPNIDNKITAADIVNTSNDTGGLVKGKIKFVVKHIPNTTVNYAISTAETIILDYDFTENAFTYPTAARRLLTQIEQALGVVYDDTKAGTDFIIESSIINLHA